VSHDLLSDVVRLFAMLCLPEALTLVRAGVKLSSSTRSAGSGGQLPTAQEIFILDIKLLEGTTPPHSPDQSAARSCVSAMGGVCSSDADAVPLTPPHEPPAAAGQAGGAAANDDDNNNFSPLLDLVERFPGLFAQAVLAHLDPIDLTFLAQTGGACREAVAGSDLPRAGTRRVVVLGMGATTRRVLLWVVTLHGISSPLGKGTWRC